MHAVSAGNVASGGDDAAFAAADDERLIGEAGIVALLDRGVERIAIDMGDRKRAKLRVDEQPRRPAGRAAAVGGRTGDEAIAAKGIGIHAARRLPRLGTAA